MKLAFRLLAAGGALGAATASAGVSTNAPRGVDRITTPWRQLVGGSPSTGAPSQPNDPAAGDVRGPVSDRVVAHAFGEADILAFGGKCDGTFDNGPLANTLLRTYRAVVFPMDGCTRPFAVDTTIVVPAGGEIIGRGMMRAASTPSATPSGIATRAAVDTFAAGGDRTGYRDLAITHTGAAGKVIDLRGTSFASIEHDEITAISATNGEPAVYGYGAQHQISHTRFNHYRAKANAIAVDSKSNSSPFVQAAVNWDIGDDVIFGSTHVGLGTPGPGILVYSSSRTSTQAPQGIYIHHTTIQTEGASNLVVQQVVNLLATDDTFDSGAGIVLNPVAGGQGIFGAQFHGGYVSTPTNPRNGSCIAQIGNAAAITDLQVQGMILSGCGYGIAATAGNNTGMQIEGNVLFSIARAAVNVQNATKATITGNMAYNVFDSTVKPRVPGVNLVLADGAAGGPFVVDDNQWDPNAGMAIKETNPSNFSFGNGNTGKRLAGTAAADATFPSTGAHCVVADIPHGLAGTPNPDKTLLTIQYLRGGRGAFTNVTVANSAPDATSLHAQVCATVTKAGVLRVVAQSSL